MQVEADNFLYHPLGEDVWVELQLWNRRTNRQNPSTLGFGGFCPRFVCPAFLMTKIEPVVRLTGVRIEMVGRTSLQNQADRRCFYCRWRGSQEFLVCALA